jgi:hypothetical protein
MAQVKTIHCDRCGVLVSKAHVLLVVKIGSLPRLSHGRGIDFCGTCGAEFEAWLGPRPDPAAYRDETPHFEGVG